MRARLVWLVLVCLLTGGGASLAAQTRAITGTVTDSTTGAPIPGAAVSVVGTRLGVNSRDNGNFIIPNAPDGAVRLLFRAIGYRRIEVTVGADESSVDVALARDPFKLEELVVTGQSTGISKQNLPNAVSVVTADELQRAPTATLEQAMQGKVPGAYIQENSGAPGGGIQVQLRGISTINGPVDPLFVVDGIVVSNAAIPNGQNAVTAAAAGGNASNQDNPVNRIADLNPADIERIEILKGGSAASIYGSKATNGVVIITTKRGTAGRPQFNLTQRFGMFSVAKKLGQRVFETVAEAETVYDPALVAQHFTPGQRVDWEDLLYGRNALSTETQLGVTGGTEQTKYYLSGVIKNDEGIAINTDYKKQGVRANLDQVLGSRFNVTVSTNVVHTKSNRGLSNNDNTGTSPGLVLPFTPSFFDPRPSGGVFPDNPFERSNPLQTFTLLTNAEDVWRALGTVTTRFNAVNNDRHALDLAVIGGADYFSQRNDFLSPPEMEYEPNDGQAGTVILGKASNLNLNLTVNGLHRYTPVSQKFRATTSVGIQYEDRELNTTSILGRSLLTGQSSPDQATSRDVTQDINKTRDLGIYAQEEVLLMQERLLLTVGVRADRSSNNGDPDKYYYFPKGAASYRFLNAFGPGNEVKLRAAYGETGNQPVFGAKFTPDTSGVIDGRFGVQVGQRAGDPDIRPERQKEIEAGVDAQLFHNRASLSLTVYQRRITDLLLEQTLAPSSGQVSRIFNSGAVLRNRGLEIGLQLVPVQSRKIYWVFGTTFALNRSKITKNPLPPFQVGGFGTNLGAFQIERGKSATQIIGLANDGDTTIAIGDAYPDFQMGFSNDVEIGRFRVGMLWDWKKGGDIINLTRLLFDAGQNSPDKADGGLSRLLQWAAGNTGQYLEDASYLKLRELSLSYDLPQNLVATMFGGSARYARLTLAGRNLIRITNYEGYDPEVSNFGNQAIVRNIDVAPFPPSRSWFLSIDVGF
jgi:TonB-linked SusC/RagA family outer membrane protein